MGRGNGGEVGQNPLGDRLLSSSNHTDSNADPPKIIYIYIYIYIV